MELIDSHCHLTWPDYDTERDAVLQRARDTGVAVMIAIGAGQGLDGNRQAIALAEQDTHIVAAIGIHPCDAALFEPLVLTTLTQLAAHPKVVAIGEIGLDYHHNTATREQQHTAFEALLTLAHAQNLPVIIHQRDAEEDLLSILRNLFARRGSQPMGVVRGRAGSPPDFSERPALPARANGVVHCFGGSLAFAQQLLDLGLHLGIGGVVTFKNAETLRDVVRAIPLDRILLETDAPFLAPVPYRGQRNEPAYVVETAKVIAQIKGLSIDAVAEATTANARRLFRC